MGGWGGGYDVFFDVSFFSKISGGWLVVVGGGWWLVVVGGGGWWLVVGGILSELARKAPN